MAAGQSTGDDGVLYLSCTLPMPCEEVRPLRCAPTKRSVRAGIREVREAVGAAVLNAIRAPLQYACPERNTKRRRGTARGGVSTSVRARGVQAPMRVGGEYLAVSLTVMENDDMPFLFGLDMLRRHQARPPA